MSLCDRPASSLRHALRYGCARLNPPDIMRFFPSRSSDGGRGATKLRSKAAKGKEKELRARLKGMLSQTVMLRGISAKYLGAGGSSSFANQMLKGSNHKTMLGLPSSRAVDDVRR